MSPQRNELWSETVIPEELTLLAFRLRCSNVAFLKFIFHFSWYWSSNPGPCLCRPQSNTPAHVHMLLSCSTSQGTCSVCGLFLYIWTSLLGNVWWPGSERHPGVDLGAVLFTCLPVGTLPSLGACSKLPFFRALCDLLPQLSLLWLAQSSGWSCCTVHVKPPVPSSVSHLLSV